jgi:hypothetical protein
MDRAIVTSKPVRVALYVRISPADKDQNPDTQLLPLREVALAQGWQTTEYVDYARANDVTGRTAWTAIMDAAAKRTLDLIIVWRLNRAFRSVAHARATVRHLERWGVGLRSYMEPWLDTVAVAPRERHRMKRRHTLKPFLHRPRKVRRKEPRWLHPLLFD